MDNLSKFSKSWRMLSMLGSDVSNPLLDDEDEVYPIVENPVVERSGMSQRGSSTRGGESIVEEHLPKEDSFFGYGAFSGSGVSSAVSDANDDTFDDVARFEQDFPDGHGDWVESVHRMDESFDDVSDTVVAGFDSSSTDDFVDGVGVSDGLSSDDAEPLSFGGDSLEDLLGPVDGSDDVAASEDLYDSMDSILAAADGALNEDDSSYYAVTDDDDELGGLSLDAIIGQAIEMEASDIHLSSDDMVAFTILGEIHRIPDWGVLNSVQVQRIYTSIASHVSQDDFAKDLELDTSYVVKTGRHRGRRLRLSVGRSFHNVFMVFRVIADVIPTPQELGVSGSLLEWCNLPNGLVMMNGPTGTGKSTTLASLLRQIQLTRPAKIITIEKPIEFVYGTDGKALVTQREVGGRDTRTFAGALTSAMRQAPDIIMLGEVRNQVEVNELLRAAETGHLAISTMHTNSAPATVNRIKGLYQGDDQIRILGSLSEVVRGFANQVLLKTPDGSGRFAVREVLDVDETVSRMILRGDVEGIKNYQMSNGITMEHELVKVVLGGRANREEARRATSNVARFDHLLKQAM